MLQPTVKRINKKRPGEASDDFMVGKESKWSNAEADLPEWTRASPEERSKVKWKSPRFMARAERKGAMRVKGILKKVKPPSGLVGLIRFRKRRREMRLEILWLGLLNRL